jgi:hypothetical protein
MIWAGVLWGWFTAEQLSRVVLSRIGAPAPVIESVAPHPVRVVLYGMWIVSLLWFGWRILGPRRGDPETRVGVYTQS